MAVTVKAEEFVRPESGLIEAVGRQTVFLERDGKAVGALISMDQYESTGEARAERAIQAMKALSAHMASVASPGELEQLVRELDTKRS
jgi:hypothetical protein